MAENTEAAVENLDPASQVNLQIQDIENAVKVIDFAAEQGAFKGWQTINEVMAIRNRLVLFLRAVAPPEGQAEGEPAVTEGAV